MSDCGRGHRRTSKKSIRRQGGKHVTLPGCVKKGGTEKMEARTSGGNKAESTKIQFSSQVHRGLLEMIRVHELWEYYCVVAALIAGHISHQAHKD